MERLILCGGGHVSLEVAHIARRLEFELVVIDDRPEFASRERFPIAELEPGYPLPLHQWVNACTGQGENLCDVAAGELVNRVLDAAARAMESHRTEPI